MNLSSPAAVAALLKRHNFAPAYRLGQNFLVDGNILSNIASAGELEPGDTVLEIGTGLGVLTQALAERVGAQGLVVTVERDRRLAAVYAETLPSTAYPQVRCVTADALVVDLDANLAHSAGSGRAPAVVANIPYNITAPLLERLLEHRPQFRVIVLLVQREVGERMVARPATPQYGAFSVFVQYHAQVELLGTVSPTVFFPPPKIVSVIARLRPTEPSPVAVPDPSLLFAVVKAAFQQRRKTLSNALGGSALGWSRDEIHSALARAHIDGARRGETLTLAEFAAIAQSARNESATESV